jgi:hypothetical protein
LAASARRTDQSAAGRGSQGLELALEEPAQLLRVGLALGALHPLPHKEHERVGLALAVILDGLRVRRQHLIRHALQCLNIGDLLQSLPRDQLRGIHSLLEHLDDDVLGHLA